jgi:hypothetical protein
MFKTICMVSLSRIVLVGYYKLLILTKYFLKFVLLYSEYEYDNFITFYKINLQEVLNSGTLRHFQLENAWENT